jgi:hypothetical protein
MARARRSKEGIAHKKAHKKALKGTNPHATFPTNFRLSLALVQALDAWVEHLNAKNTMGRQWTRTDVVQDSLAYAVRVWGKEGSLPGDPDVKDAAA